MNYLQHPFGPLFNENSRVLILGSFPSVRSREQNFFYGHPQNRFWKVIAAVFDQPVPQSIEEKREQPDGEDKKEIQRSDPAKKKRAARRIQEDRPMGAYEKGAVPL